MIDITEEDAIEMYKILKEIIKHHEWDSWKCAKTKGTACKICLPINKAYEIIADIESEE